MTKIRVYRWWKPELLLALQWAEDSRFIKALDSVSAINGSGELVKYFEERTGLSFGICETLFDFWLDSDKEWELLLEGEDKCSLKESFMENFQELGDWIRINTKKQLRKTLVGRYMPSIDSIDLLLKETVEDLMRKTVKDLMKLFKNSQMNSVLKCAFNGLFVIESGLPFCEIDNLAYSASRFDIDGKYIRMQIEKF